MLTVVLLTVSNVFMTIAWYGHLRFKESPLWIAIAASWLIAFFEYCLQVPANRWGHAYFSGSQLKIIQEVITLAVFCVFSVFYLKEELRWNHVVGFGLVLASVLVVFGFESRGNARRQALPQPLNSGGDPKAATAIGNEPRPDSRLGS